MKKIFIIGSSGTGKTTLARHLYSALHIRAVHLDRLFWYPAWKQKTKDKKIDILQSLIKTVHLGRCLFWYPGWKPKNRDERIDVLQNIIMEKSWIVEGIYIDSSAICLEETETIIFLDIPPWLCLQRVMKRHIIHRRRPRRDIPEGCTDELNLRGILKILTFPFRGRKKIERKLLNCTSQQVIRLRSPQEVDNFLAQIKQDIAKKESSSLQGERQPVGAGR